MKTRIGIAQTVKVLQAVILTDTGAHVQGEQIALSLPSKSVAVLELY